MALRLHSSFWLTGSSPSEFSWFLPSSLLPATRDDNDSDNTATWLNGNDCFSFCFLLKIYQRWNALPFPNDHGWPHSLEDSFRSLFIIVIFVSQRHTLTQRKHEVEPANRSPGYVWFSPQNFDSIFTSVISLSPFFKSQLFTTLHHCRFFPARMDPGFVRTCLIITLFVLPLWVSRTVTFNRLVKAFPPARQPNSHTKSLNPVYGGVALLWV